LLPGLENQKEPEEEYLGNNYPLPGSLAKQLVALVPQQVANIGSRLQQERPDLEQKQQQQAKMMMLQGHLEACCNQGGHTLPWHDQARSNQGVCSIPGLEAMVWDSMLQQQKLALLGEKHDQGLDEQGDCWRVAAGEMPTMMQKTEAENDEMGHKESCFPWNQPCTIDRMPIAAAYQQHQMTAEYKMSVMEVLGNAYLQKCSARMSAVTALIEQQEPDGRVDASLAAPGSCRVNNTGGCTTHMESQAATDVLTMLFPASMPTGMPADMQL